MHVVVLFWEKTYGAAVNKQQYDGTVAPVSKRNSGHHMWCPLLRIAEN